MLTWQTQSLPVLPQFEAGQVFVLLIMAVTDDPKQLSVQILTVENPKMTTSSIRAAEFVST